MHSIKLSELIDRIKESKDISLTLDGISFDVVDDVSISNISYQKFAQSCFEENPADIQSAVGIVSELNEDAKTNINHINRMINILHCMAGIQEEMGEVMGHIKKHLFHSEPLDHIKLKMELGDHSWYYTNLLLLLEIEESDIKQSNVLKLNRRYPNGRSKGMIVKRNHEEEEKYVLNNSK